MAQASTGLRLIETPDNAGRKIVTTVGLGKKAVVQMSYDVPWTASVERDNGRTGGHRLNHRLAERFLDGRNGHDIGRGI